MVSETSNLATALAAFQKALPTIVKDKNVKTEKYRYTYADLAVVAQAVLPKLGEQGLSFLARPTLDDGGRFVLAYELLHVSGESRGGTYPLPAANTPAQQMGSAITYARRYCLLSITGVMPEDEDDDAQAAPPASRQPVERHESHWDPAEQEMLRTGWEAEIDAARNGEEIREIGRKILAQKRSGEMSPTTYQHLATRGGKRKAELDTEAEQPATVTAPPDRLPSRRGAQMAAMDRAAAQRREAADATPAP